MPRLSLARFPGWLVHVQLVLRLLAFAVVARLPVQAAAASDDATRLFDIPAGEAADTLKRTAQQGGLEIVFLADTVRGVRTAAVLGAYAPRAALDLLVRGTDLVVVRDERTGTLTVHRVPVDGASSPKPESKIKTMKTPDKKSSSGWFPAFLALLAADPAGAQTVASPSAATAPDSAVVLSPFEVRTEKDQGYLASDSLAGSRFNTSLKDIAAPISVMTKEFLDDIGLVDVNQALEYGTNTLDEIDATGNGRVSGNGVSFKVRGIAGGGRARNYFSTGQNVDFYNTERLDLSRGPNSVLFGLGSPAGIINSSTKFARIGRDFKTVGLRVGSFDDYRVTLDRNESINPKLAVRANVLWGSMQGYREFEFERKQGLALAGTWRPWPKTQIKAEGEQMNREQSRARPWTPVDFYSVWAGVGRPGAGSATTWGNAVSGTSGTTNLLILNSGPLAGQAFWGTTAQGFRTSNGPNTVNGLNTSPNVLDFSLIPRNANFAGPGNRLDSRSSIGSLYLEQQIGDNLFVEVAGSGEYQNSFTVGYVNFGQIGVRYDANAYLPQYNTAGVFTGTVPNPNFGKMFLQAGPNNVTDSFRHNFSTEMRATVGYNLDFAKLLSGKNTLGRLLGRHRLGYLYTDRFSDTDNLGQRRVNVSPLRPGGPASSYFSGANQISIGSYIDPFSRTISDRGYLDVSGYAIPDQVIRGNNAFSLRSERRNQTWTWSQTLQQTHMFATQSHFWHDRLVALLGWRRDSTKSFGSVQVVDPITGEVTGYTRNTVPNGVSVLSPSGVSEGNTFTRGLVVHALPNLLSFYYNEANNFQIRATAEVFGERNNQQPVGNRQGEGQDAGLRLNLFHGSVSARAGWYRTADVNQALSLNGVYQVYINGIWDGIFNATGAVGQPKVVGGTANLAQADSRDFTSQGVEFEVTANPIRQLRLTVNFSRGNAINTNILPFLQAYVAANRAEWARNSAVRINQAGFANTAATVGAVLTQIDNQLLADLASNGQRPIRDRKYSGNAFANYTFANEGLLKGWGLGAGVNYRGPALLAYRVFTDGKPAFTPVYTSFNAVASYRKRLSKRLNLTVQLNVQNLLNDLKPQAVAGGEPPNLATNTLPLIDGVAYAIQLPEPRRYALSATLEF